MLTRTKLNQYIQDSINAKHVTEELVKALDKFYIQVNSLVEDKKKLISDKDKLTRAILFYALGNHISHNLGKGADYSHIGNIAVEAGKIARDALLETDTFDARIKRN